MKPELSVFVDRLEKMLKKCKPESIRRYCPGAPFFNHDKGPRAQLNMCGTWCSTCRKFMAIPPTICPCNYYGDYAYYDASDRVKTYRALEGRTT